jgi:glyoxylase-like metal-dependent hydrolase (beta-lactamase superfamily II)
MTDSNKVLETYAVGPVQCNCSILGCRNSRACIIVDPGGDAGLILDRVAALGLNVRYVLITHAHFDHVLAARAIKLDFGTSKARKNESAIQKPRTEPFLRRASFTNDG